MVFSKKTAFADYSFRGIAKLITFAGNQEIGETNSFMLFGDEYKTIENTSQGTFRDRGSKFLAFAFPVSGEAEAKRHLDGLRKQYHDATHHCYAYVLGFDKSVFRVNDDGEPSGTAGRPIYGQILSADLTNVLVAVVRYYGGTKLGVPGLINAYKTASREAISNATTVTRVAKELYRIEFPYEAMNDVMKIIKDESLEVINNDFGMNCVMRLAVRQRDAEQANARFAKIKPLVINHLSFYL